MSVDWYLMHYSPSMLGGYESDSFNDNAEDCFEELLDSFIGEEVELYNSKLEMISKIKVVIQGKVANTELKSMDREGLVPIGTCKAGMYMKIKNRYWMVSGLVDNNGFYEKTILSYCNYYATWQNDKYETLGRWVVVASNAQYNSGETFNKTFTLETDQLGVIFPLDDDTLCIDSQKRFFISYNKKSKKVYQVSRVDTVPYYYGENDGIVPVIMMQDEVRDTDRPDLGICDYIDPSTLPSPTTPTDPNKTAILSNIKFTSAKLKSGNRPIKFYAEFKDEDENVLTDIIPLWTINSGLGNKLKTKILDDYIELSIDDDMSIGRSFTISLTDNDQKASETELVITVTSLYEG